MRKRETENRTAKRARGLISQLVFLTILAAAAHAKPDLIISRVEVIKDASGFYVGKIAVTVLNGCRDASRASDVLVTFKESERGDAKTMYYVGGAVKALRGGESYTQTFDVADKKIGVGRYIYVEADPYKKITEASEDNNWRTVFPDGAGTILSGNQCAQ